jgi:hypothetical protein
MNVYMDVYTHVCIFMYISKYIYKCIHRYWCGLILRNLYKKKCVTELRYLDSQSRLEWIGLESMLLLRLKFHLHERIEIFSEISNSKLILEWLNRYIEYCDTLLSSFDSQQVHTCKYTCTYIFVYIYIYMYIFIVIQFFI